MNKKFLFIGAGALVLVLIIVLVAISCSGSGSKTAVKGSGSLTVWGLDDPSIYESVIKDFQSTNPTYKVTYIQKDAADYQTAALSEIAAGKGPDVWAIPSTWIPKFRDKLVPIPENFFVNKNNKQTNIDTYKSLFPSIVVQDNVFDNKIYGMPLTIDNLVLFYNKDTLNKTLNDYFDAGNKDESGTITQAFRQGPVSWDDFVSMVKIITKKNGANITQSAVSLGTDSIAHASDILTLLMLQDGAKMTSEDLTTAQFHTKQNVFGGTDFPGTQALNFYTAFSDPKTDLYTWNDSLGDDLHAFADGKTAMMINYTSVVADLTRINPNLNYGYFSIPQVKETKNPINFASYNTYTVTKASDDSKTAWNFINSLTNSTKTENYVTKIKGQNIQSDSITTNSKEGKRINTSQSWYNPDPDKTQQIFANIIQQVNDGKNAQTAIEYAGSQVSELLQKLKE